MNSESRTAETSTKGGVCRIACWGVLVAVVVGGYLRFDALAEHDLWLDESCTFYYVHNLMDWPADGPDARLELTTVPYTYLLYGWTRLTGETAFGLRSFSALAGTLTIAVMAFIAWRMAGPWAAVVVAGLLAVHPLHIHYSREARVYALWVLEVAMLTFALWRAACGGRSAWWVVYALLALLAVWTHYYTLFLLPATVAAFVLSDNARKFLVRYVATHIAMAALLLPMFFLLIFPVMGRGSQAWLQETWAGYPPALAVLKSLWAALPSGGYPSYIGRLPVADAVLSGGFGNMVAVAVQWIPALVLGGWLAAWLFSRRAGRNGAGNLGASDDGETLANCDADSGGRDRSLGYLLAMGLGGLIVPFCYSLFAGPAYIVGRYDLISFPTIALSTAILVTIVPGRSRVWGVPRAALTASVAFLLILCGAVTCCAVRSIPPSDEVARRAKGICDQTGDDDLIVSFNMYRWHLEYELSTRGFKAEMISWPPNHDEQVGWQNAADELRNPARLAEQAVDTIARIGAKLDRGGRVWLIFTGEPGRDRQAVDGLLLRGLMEEGLVIEQADAWLGLASVKRPDENHGDDENSEGTSRASGKEDANMGSDLSESGSRGQSPTESERVAERQRMVGDQLVARGITDEKVLKAMRRVPRHWFVPDRLSSRAYDDRPLPIGFDQTISQPYIVALMTERLHLSAESRVLEVGTGSGYQAAVLSEITPHVFSIEIVEPLAKLAIETFKRRGYDSIKVRIGDGFGGWPEEAPFDAIVVTCAPDEVPPALIEQLAVGGRLCVPVGSQAGSQELLVITKLEDGTIRKESGLPVRFVPMTGEAQRDSD